MLRGLQSAASGMIAQMQSQDVTANNLANANTAGYKREVPSFGSVLANIEGAAPMMQLVTNGGVNFAQGSLIETGNDLNMALQGDGFFEVQTPNGPAYTRDGTFSVSRDGYLVTQSGNRVMGSTGPIQLGKGEIDVDAKGQIMQGGKSVGTLKVVQFSAPQGLKKLGENLWTAGGSAPSADTQTRISQGYLESSNVNTVQEMVNMITALRSYEASQKSIQAQDQTLDKAVNEVGRV